MARLFLAIWPDAQAHAALARLAQDVALVAEGRPMTRDKIHLTLAFLGEVGDERRGAVEAVAGAVRAPRFTLVLDRVGSFRRSKVAWAGSSRDPAPLVELQRSLEQGLRDVGFALETRPFQAHVTLARKTAKPLPAAAIEPIPWQCEAVALVVSNLGSGTYSTLESWPLG
jgi:2'-5' RNA ligase